MFVGHQSLLFVHFHSKPVSTIQHFPNSMILLIFVRCLVGYKVTLQGDPEQVISKIVNFVGCLGFVPLTKPRKIRKSSIFVNHFALLPLNLAKTCYNPNGNGFILEYATFSIYKDNRYV